MSVRSKDLAFGFGKEESEFSLIKNALDSNLVKTPPNYVFDYESNESLVELKSRRNTKDKYPDTMVGKNKLDACNKTSKHAYFVFSFTDGLYYWKYNENDLTNGNVTFRRGGRNDRGKPEWKDNYAYINTQILIKI
jgi:hypothetical protein